MLLKSKSPDLLSHSEDTASLAVVIAEQLNPSPAFRRDIFVAGFCHYVWP